MFTGIICVFGKILKIIFRNVNIDSAHPAEDSKSLRDNITQLVILIPHTYVSNTQIGQSIAIDGCCLTVVKLDLHDDTNDVLTFDIMEETLKRTSFNSFKDGQLVHCERALSMGDGYDGHVLTGHISGTVYLCSREYHSDGSLTLIFSLDNANQYLQYKDSVAIDGVSLTVSAVTLHTFSVCLIPHTQKMTHLDRKEFGYPFNVEFAKISPELSTQLSVKSSLSTDYMMCAHRLAKRGRRTAPSNPWVGAVIVDANGSIVGEGFHRKRGEKHAEVNAINDALTRNINLNTCVMYCTLEPCCTRSPTKLQPPCTEAVIASGIKRIIIGICDPDTRMAGKGIAILREAGIEVNCLDHPKIIKSLRSYIHHRKTGQPYVIGKAAISLDGKMALASGISKWLTSDMSRYDAHHLRLKCQAILVGTQTALLDEPNLTVRLSIDDPLYTISQEVKPLRCFVDKHGCVKSGPLMDLNLGPVCVFTNLDTCSQETLKLWKDRGLQIENVDSDPGGRLCIDTILKILGSKGVLQLLVEGGPNLLSEFYQTNKINELVLYQAPIFLGNNGRSIYNLPGPKSMESVVRMKPGKIKQIQSDLRITLYPRNN